MTQQLEENTIYDQSFADLIKSYQAAIREKGFGGRWEVILRLETVFQSEVASLPLNVHAFLRFITL